MSHVSTFTDFRQGKESEACLFLFLYLQLVYVSSTLHVHRVPMVNIVPTLYYDYVSSEHNHNTRISHIQTKNKKCGRGADGILGRGTFDIQFSGDVPFWGYVYGFAREVSFAYPLPFEMRPIGCKF